MVQVQISGNSSYSRYFLCDEQKDFRIESSVWRNPLDTTYGSGFLACCFYGYPRVHRGYNLFKFDQRVGCETSYPPAYSTLTSILGVADGTGILGVEVDQGQG